MTMRVLTVAVGVTLLLSGTTVWAKKGGPKPTPAQKCTAGKLRAAGQYELCRLSAEAHVVVTMGAPDFSTCDSNLSTKWAKIESKANGACPITGDVASVQAQVTADETVLASAIHP